MKCKFCSKEHTNNNTGCFNSGYYNSGYRNSGDRNSGDYNSGYRNSGYRNSGDYNSGYYNSGDRNSGDYNSGDRNSGYYNSGDRNSGWFNTNEPKMRMFNRDTNMTYSEFVKNNKIVYPDLKICAWVENQDLPEEEKNEITSQMGGKLKNLTYKEAWKEYWDRTSNENKKWFMNLPNFSADIFKEITGIDINGDDEIQKAIKLLQEKGLIIDGKIIK